MASALKDYLQRYVGSVDTSGIDSGKVKPKKKKRKGKGGGGDSNAGKGVVIVDDDAPWKKEEKEDEDEPDEEGDGPMVIEDAEVKRMQRMEALKTYRPYLSVANDGSGWVPVRKDEPEASSSVRRRDYGSDNSASRSPRGKSPDFSAKRKRNDSPDLSPPRERIDSPRRGVLSADLSPRRRSKPSARGRKEEESRDLSPPRNRKDSPDLSPPRRRHDSPSISPPRRPVSNDLSPPRTSKVSAASRNRNQPQDLSPPRKRRDYRDLSPLRRRQESSDMAPARRLVSEDPALPRRSKFSAWHSDGEDSRDSSLFGKNRGFLELSSQRQRHDSPEMSPGRRVISEDSSPPRRSKTSTAPGNRYDSQDLSPRRRRRDSPDASPVRRVVSKDSSPPRKSRNLMSVPNLDQSQTIPQKKLSGRMADGDFAGLKSDRDVVSEAERKRAAEAKFLSELDPSLSGRGAETVFRDKRGRRLEGLEEMLRQQKGEAKPAEQPLEWGKGLAQKKVADANLAELEAEKSKPFARYRDDAELDKSLRERSRWGDPMAHLVKKQVTEPVLEDLGAREEMKSSGFIVPQDIPKHSWLKGGLAPPPNRYDIRPGRHWDGVDRSTGFEQGLFKQKNEKKARDLEAYLWSVSDM